MVWLKLLVQVNYDFYALQFKKITGNELLFNINGESIYFALADATRTMLHFFAHLEE